MNKNYALKVTESGYLYGKYLETNAILCLMPHIVYTDLVNVSDFIAILPAYKFVL